MRKNEIKNFLPSPPSQMPFHIEVDKYRTGISISVSGVKRINEFSDALIRLRITSFSLEVVGAGLCMTVFEDKNVEIIGKISEVRFLYDKT